MILKSLAPHLNQKLKLFFDSSNIINMLAGKLFVRYMTEVVGEKIWVNDIISIFSLASRVSMTF